MENPSIIKCSYPNCQCTKNDHCPTKDYEYKLDRFTPEPPNQAPPLSREELVKVIAAKDATIAEQEKIISDWKANFDTQHEDKASLQHQLRQEQLKTDAQANQIKGLQRTEQDYMKLKIKFDYLEEIHTELITKVVENQR